MLISSMLCWFFRHLFIHAKRKKAGRSWENQVSRQQLMKDKVPESLASESLCVSPEFHVHIICLQETWIIIDLSVMQMPGTQSVHQKHIRHEV